MRFKSDVGSSPPPFKRVVRLMPLCAALIVDKKNHPTFHNLKILGGFYEKKNYLVYFNYSFDITYSIKPFVPTTLIFFRG